METINLLDGLILTIISMIVVFIVLGAIWGLTELVARIVGKAEMEISEPTIPTEATTPTSSVKKLVSNKNNQKVAEIMALILASEDQPNKKFEIIETKRIK